MQIHPSKTIGNTKIEKHLIKNRKESLPYGNPLLQQALFLIDTKPKESLELFLKMESDIKHPQIYRYITFLYLKKRRIKKARAVILKTYEYFPKDPLSIIHYADHLVMEKKLNEWEQLIHLPYNLPKQLNLPHLSLKEMQAFLLVITQYHTARKHYTEANGYLSLFEDLYPDHPLIKTLHKKISSLNKRHRLPWRSWWSS